jgi:DNA polymerase (family 10)
MLAPAEYRALLRRSRVFLSAPRREDYGIAQLEALADGCLLVTTPAPGPYAALPLARDLDPRLVGPDLAIRTALDDPDELLQRLDWTIGSIHTSFGMDEAAMTDRMVAAIEHPWLDAIGHPTGRKIETRPPYALDMTRVIAAAAANGTMIEINAAPDRRDMNESHARAAAEAGVMVLVDSDAHSAKNFELLKYGIATARRAWLSPEQVANTRSWEDFAPLRKRAK